MRSTSPEGMSRSAIIVASANGQPVWRRKATTAGRPEVRPGGGSGGAGSPGAGGAAVASARGGTKVRRFTPARVVRARRSMPEPRRGVRDALDLCPLVAHHAVAPAAPLHAQDRDRRAGGVAALIEADRPDDAVPRARTHELRRHRAA